ncbi:MAG: MucB/RseB C-terminal domain-containing protein [Gammaproteobacteria bacterium]|nr:MucB/RseB C-terminal domain-containing protein [Gammaproteobacteria bacterium]
MTHSSDSFLNNRWSLGLVLGLLLLPVATPAAAWFGKDPAAWLEQMNTALGSVNYRGTFVYIHHDEADTMLVIHRVDEDGTRERLVSLNGSAREVVRDDDTVKCFLPDDRAVLVEKRHDAGTLTKGVPLNAAQYDEHYAFELQGISRIAGRKAQLIAINPRDGYRYGYRLWLDDETALPLRSELVNDQGQPIEKMIFTEIEIGVDIPDEDLDPTISGEGFEWLVQETEAHSRNRSDIPVSFNGLPAGFGIKRAEAEGEGDGRSYHVVLSDGLSSVSVFAEPVSKDRPTLAGLSKLGAVNAFGIRRDTHHVTVVGEVPEATVTAIGEAVRLASN